MNSLTKLISHHNLDEQAVLNYLQGEAGVISDLCLGAEDVAGVNCFLACSVVLSHLEMFQQNPAPAYDTGAGSQLKKARL